MPMHISPSTDTDPGRAETMLPRMGPITNPLPPATQTDVLGILQREQDRAIALLSSSPLLTSLFVSYANQATAFESASATPSLESEEWKTLQNTIVTLRKEIEKLESMNLEVTEGLEAAEASREAFRSQVLSLKEVNTTRENEIKSLRTELAEAKEKYDRLMVDSNAEKAALQIRVLDLEAQRGELKEAVVEQQIKISKLGRQGSSNPPIPLTAAIPTDAAYARKIDTPEGLNAVQSEPSIPSTVDWKEVAEKYEKEAQEKKEREERDRVEREDREEKKRQEKAELQARRKKEREEREERAEKERVEREAREQAEREVREQAEREVKELAERVVKEKVDGAVKERVEKKAAKKAAREARQQSAREAREKDEQVREKAEREAREKDEREEKKRLEREERLEKEERERIEREEKEKAEREAKEEAAREAKERGEEKNKVPASKIPSGWGSTIGKNDRSRKASGLSQKEQKNEWASSWDFGSTEKDEHSGLPPITTSSVPGSIFDGGDFFTTGENDSPGSAGEVELRTPLTKKGIDNLSNLSKVATPTEPADLGRLDGFEDLNMNNMSARVSVSSENERFTDAEQVPSPTQTTHPSLAPEITPEVLPSTTSELLEMPKNVKREVPMTPHFWPAPPHAPTHQAQATPKPLSVHPVQAPTLDPAPAKTEPEKPLSLWERKKLKATTQPAPASSLFGGGGVTNSSGVWGEASGSGGNTKSIVLPTLVGDRQSAFTDTAHDQKSENQQGNLVEGFLGSNPARKRSDLAQSQMTAKPVTKPGPAPAPLPQKPSGWGSWGSSLLLNIENQVTAERSSSPGSFPAIPKIEGPPRGFTPNQPPTRQPAGFGLMNKPSTWGTGVAGDNNA